MSTTFRHDVGGSGPAAGMSLTGLHNGITPSEGVPLVVALHGAAWTSRYFDVAEHSLLERAVAPEIPVLALDRPGHGGSSPLPGPGRSPRSTAPADSSTIGANATVLRDAIGSLWRERGGHAAGVVLVGHGVGAAVALRIAAELGAVDRPPEEGDPSRTGDWSLLGVSISGCLVETPVAIRDAWQALPEQELVDLGPALLDRLCFGPEGTFLSSMPEACHPAYAPAPRAELVELSQDWSRERAEICAGVRVPVQHRHGVHDPLWVSEQDQIEEFTAAFTGAPSVDSRLQLHSGHCIDFHIPAAAFQTSQLGFALDCAGWSES